MQPTISIITVVYNGENLIQGTIESILNQTYDKIEYIIIDGASSDETLKIIQSYDKIDIVISEPDQGLYDAMNKGLKKASGDYVLFMNCGDHLFDKYTIENVFKNNDDMDIYYGDVMMVNDARTHLGLRSEITPHQLPEQLNWKSLQRGMVVSHQAFIVKKEITTSYILNNLCADIDWVIIALQKAKKIKHTHLVIASFLIGGTSRKYHQQSLKDRFSILKKHYGFIPNIMNHIIIVTRAFFRKIVRKNKMNY